MTKRFQVCRPLSISAAVLSAGAMLAQPAFAKPTFCPDAFEKVDRQTATADMVMRSEVMPTMTLDQPYQEDWLLHGRMGYGNDPHGANRLEPWMAIFATRDNGLADARVEFRDLEVYVLSKRTAMWARLYSGQQVNGWFFTEPAASHAVARLNMEFESSFVSISVDQRYMSHFWYEPQVPIDANDIAGIYVVASARMNPADYAAGARYVMDVSADYYRVDMLYHATKMKNLGDAGIGRLKLLTPQWRKFYMTTVKPIYLDLCIGSTG